MYLMCFKYSIEIDLNFNALKSYCVAFLPKLYKLALPELHINSMPISYTDSIKYLGYIFSSNNNDDAEMLRQMRLLYCRSNRLVRLFSKHVAKLSLLSYVEVFAQRFTVLFSKCSKTVLIELCRSFCTTFYCPYFWTQYKKATFSKLRVAYNNVYRKILGLCRRSSASEMFVTNNILNFEALIRKSIFAFTSRLSISNNAIICTIQKSWVIRETVWKSWTDKLYL